MVRLQHGQASVPKSVGPLYELHGQAAASMQGRTFIPHHLLALPPQYRF
jgi:hypothetical protein